MFKKSLLLIGLCFLCGIIQAQELKSPDGNLVLNFQLTDQGVPTYNLTYKNKDVIKDSKLGFAIASGTGQLDKDFKVVDVKYTSEDSTWKPVWGEQSEIRTNYNEMF